MLLFLGAAGAAIVPFLTSIAQREQIMVILMLPWVVGKVVATPSGRNEAARAALAAIGICLKPYFVLYPILSTVLEIGHTRSLKPVFATANLAFLGVALGYLALAFALHPLYFTDIVPTASQIYGAYKFSSDVIVSVIWEVPVLACAAALTVGLAAGIAGRGLHYLAVFSLAALAIYLIQWTGYLYQFRPVLSFAILGCAWVLGSAPGLAGGQCFGAGVGGTGISGRGERVLLQAVSAHHRAGGKRARGQRSADGLYHVASRRAWRRGRARRGLGQRVSRALADPRRGERLGHDRLR